jgi:2-iminobutanoate/2-iminopropanoate deaminase
MPVERKNYPHLDAPVGPYVHAVSYGGLLFLSGLTAFNTPAQDQNLAAQAETVFDQIRSILKLEETGFNDLIKVTMFITIVRTELSSYDAVGEQILIVRVGFNGSWVQV